MSDSPSRPLLSLKASTLLLTLITVGCAGSQAHRAARTSPETTATKPTLALPAGDPRTTAVHPPEAAPAPPASEAPSAARSKEAPLDPIISKAQEEYDLGVESLKAGEVEEARAHFDAAVEVFMNSGVALNETPRLREALDKLVDDIAALEADLEEPPGATPGAVPSPMEDLKDITTYLTPEEARREMEKVKPETAAVSFDIPMVVNDAVLGWIEIFKNTKIFRESFVGGYQRYGWYEGMIHRIFQEEGLPSDLIYMAFMESTYKTSAYSRARAKGIWQFMTPTGREYGLKVNRYVDERSNPEKSTRAAARYMKDLYDTFGDWHLAIAAYNTGAGNVMRAQKRSGKTAFWDLAKTRYMRQETKNFVPAILALALMAKDPAKYGFEGLEHNAPLQYDRVTVDGPTQLSLVARLCGVTEDEIRFLNPHLRLGVTPPGEKGYEVLVPQGHGDQFTAAYQSMPDSERIAKLAKLALREEPRRGPYHVVARGDTLSGISREYGISMRNLLAWNNISEDTVLRPGRRLVVGRSASPSAQATVVASVRKPQPAAGLVSVPGGGEATPDPAGEKVLYKVRRGDNLFRIALKFRTTVESLKAWNNIPGDSIRAGELLAIYPN